MKTIRILLMLLALELATCPKANAQNLVSQTEAVRVAVNYINGYLGGNGACTVDDLAYYSSETKSNITLLHEVHIGGYKLILSGVKSCKPVLMYTKDTTASLLLDDNGESGVSYFLNRYCNEIKYAIDSSRNSDTILEDWGILLGNNVPQPTKQDAVFGPLLTTSWGQYCSNDRTDDEASNYYVEKICSNCGTGLHSPTGCVATAVGQIMNYWKHPVYRDTSTIQFDWCNMADELYPSNSDYVIQRNAVARLLSEVGLAVNTDYCFANTCEALALPGKAESALKDDFGYSNNADLRFRMLYKKNVWKSMLICDLALERPIFYSALDEDNLFGGHAFVVHGYNSLTDVFCVNFGHLNKETWTTIDNIGLESESDYTNMENAIFDLTPENQLDYCNFDLNLSTHYQSYYSEKDTPEPYLCVPQTATTLISSDTYSPTSWRTIPTGEHSSYIAHESVVLQDGFHAERGSDFVAKILPCPNCDNNDRALSKGGNAAENMNTDMDEKSGMFDKKDTIAIVKDEGSLFPNPCKEKITYRGNGVDKVFVYDITGKPVYRWFVLSKTDKEISLDIKNIKTGLYLLYVVNKDGSHSVYKFVKE